MDQEEQVVLVNEYNVEMGTMPKLAAHQAGVLHRAFSVFVINSEGEMLLQKRASGKYHSAGLWSNTCCSHPRPGEAVKDAAMRRLDEEMGMKCEVTEAFSFIYKAHLENDLTEHEFDHVFIGFSDSVPKPNSEEVSAWAYLSPEVLMEEIALHPESYTEWLKLCIKNWQSELFNKTID
jgi:isopentenyl-diphosphate Delta-isomerase